jgi:lipid II isoglutaminyl synthase (glutamine-hydrolysing)
MKAAAVLAGKSAAAMSRLLRRGSGTAIAGLVGQRLHSDLLGELASSLPGGCVAISGTNGKTTTAKMLGDILEATGVGVVRNDAGSNLSHGIASSLIAATRLIGDRWGELGVFEVDEAAAPAVCEQMRPAVTCVLNIFRDQLDRYGDLENTAALLGRAVERGAGVTILNADDPSVASLSHVAPSSVRYFGVDTRSLAECGAEHMPVGQQWAQCPNCKSQMSFRARGYGHLGDWYCPLCGRSRPTVDFLATDVELGSQSSAFTFNAGDKSVRIHLPLSGLHNVYNALAACATAFVSRVSLDAMSSSLASYEPAFGRAEVLDVTGRRVVLSLAKNPTGASLSIASALSDQESSAIGFALNDNAADGRDVSWIWDVDFESLDLSGKHLVLSGSRADDLALRLKYAGIEERHVELCRDPANGFKQLARRLPLGGSAHMLATYTAMIRIRRAHAKGRDSLAQLGRQLRYGA